MNSERMDNYIHNHIQKAAVKLVIYSELLNESNLNIVILIIKLDKVCNFIMSS